MFALTINEIRAVIYSELRLHPYEQDLKVSQLCAISLVEAEMKREREEEDK